MSSYHSHRQFEVVIAVTEILLLDVGCDVRYRITFFILFISYWNDTRDISRSFYLHGTIHVISRVHFICTVSIGVRLNNYLFLKDLYARCKFSILQISERALYADCT